MLLREWPYNNTQNTTNKQKKHNKETKFDTADLFVDLIQKPYFEIAIFITRKKSKKILHLEEFLKIFLGFYFPFRRRNSIFKYVINSIMILTITLFRILRGKKFSKYLEYVKYVLNSASQENCFRSF